LIYATLTGALLLLFYAALGAGGALFAQLVDGGRQSVWVVSAITLLLGLLSAPLRRALQQSIDRRFFPGRDALRRRLVALAGELPALGKVPLMGRHLVERLCEIFTVRAAVLLLADPRSRLLVSVAAHSALRAGERAAAPAVDNELSLLLPPDDPGVDFLRRTHRPLHVEQIAARSPALAQRLAAVQARLAVPLVAHDELVGVLLLGGKQAAGAGFLAEELELLDLLARHVATVLENARLFESATYESLTGLLRREAILEVLEKELLRAQRYSRPLTIGMADLDHFKQINDRFGHLAGDTLLKRVAGAIAHGLRATDAVGRYGGEEFLLVLPETELAGAYAVAEKVRALVAGAHLRLDDGGEAGVTVSIGLASLAHLEGGATPQALIAAADRSLYRAKSTGRNRVEPEAASG
jgi:diguanylate cyclase (GGDEF)-like protein